MDEEYRVEVELDDPDHGYSLRERLRALDLDDKARERLGAGVMVTRDGPRLFLYVATEGQAREAERVVRELVESEDLSAETRVTRWHEMAEAWKDASVPLPASEQELAGEYAAREAAEAAEAEAEGEYDWTVVVHLTDAQGARDLEERLRSEDEPVARRWRYVTIGAVTEERATELAERLRGELPEDADVRIDVDLSDLTRSPLQFLPF
jgi:hypothetical protein